MAWLCSVDSPRDGALFVVSEICMAIGITLSKVVPAQSTLSEALGLQNRQTEARKVVSQKQSQH